MKQGLSVMIVLCMVFVFASGTFAQAGLIETVTKGCEKELMAYCKDVTPGEGRVLACLYAFSDKLSPRCEYALYDAASQLERALTALTYVANECRDDLQKLCSGTQPGQGRLLACMEKNEKKLSSRCKEAMKDTGLKKK
jgi:hypothetical protein